MQKIRAQVTMFVLIAILIVGSIVVVFVGFSNSKKFSQDNENECLADKDCSEVQASCCACEMGGGEVCVANDKAPLYTINTNNCPNDVVCAAMYNCREESCGCVNKKCAWKRY